MTTPTREQVVQWGKEAEKLANAACKEIPGMEYRAAEAFALITLARSGLEASIAEQAKQIEEMAEAIRVKDEALVRIAGDGQCPNYWWEIYARDALDLQPSPDILAERDQRVIAEYIAAMSHKESGE